MAGLVLEQDVIKRVLKQEIMRESVIYQEIKLEGKPEGLVEGLQAGIKQALEQGLKQVSCPELANQWHDCGTSGGVHRLIYGESTTVTTIQQ